jgi:ribosomal protein S12 methylthiotransferase
VAYFKELTRQGNGFFLPEFCVKAALISGKMIDARWLMCYVVAMAKRKQKVVTVGMVALGCPKNIVDSEKMLAQIGSAGFVLTGDPDNADVVVINTCGFIAPAKEEAIEAIRQAVDQKKSGSVQKVVVAGCLAQRMGEELLEEVEGIDAIVGLGGREKIADVIRQVMGKSNKAPIISMEDVQGPADDRERLLITPAHWAYLRISEGCDRKCTFCTIPTIRGRFKSKPRKMIIDEAKELVQNGAAELSIIAQDSNYYGRDLGFDNGLVNLLGELEKIRYLNWIRLMYLYPAGIDDELIEKIASSSKITNYIDMPIQHINNDILKAMRRSDRKEKTVSLIEKFRKAMPNVVLRTTIIAGFPGETDAQFDELMEFIQWAKFDALGCFTFYPEIGTPAADMPDQVPDDVKQDRADRLMAAQQKIAFAKNEQRVGSELTCLIDDVDEQSNGVGRFYGQAPHIDSVCFIDNCTAQPGEFIKTKVTGAHDYDLIVEKI